MKKNILLCAFLGIAILGYSQEVKVNINNEDATVKDECPYRINGICSSEDIGGVDAEFVVEDKGYSSDESVFQYDLYLILTNYNSFPVSVLWKISYREGGDTHQIGNNILGIEGQKKIKYYTCKYGSRQSRPSEVHSVEGLIVRSLAQNNEK